MSATGQRVQEPPLGSKPTNDTRRRRCRTTARRERPPTRSGARVDHCLRVRTRSGPVSAPFPSGVIPAPAGGSTLRFDAETTAGLPRPGARTRSATARGDRSVSRIFDGPPRRRQTTRRPGFEGAARCRAAASGLTSYGSASGAGSSVRGKRPQQTIPTRGRQRIAHAWEPVQAPSWIRRFMLAPFREPPGPYGMGTELTHQARTDRQALVHGTNCARPFPRRVPFSTARRSRPAAARHSFSTTAVVRAAITLRAPAARQGSLTARSRIRSDGLARRGGPSGDNELAAGRI